MSVREAPLGVKGAVYKICSLRQEALKNSFGELPEESPTGRGDASHACVTGYVLNPTGASVILLTDARFSGILKCSGARKILYSAVRISVLWNTRGDRQEVPSRAAGDATRPADSRNWLVDERQ